MEKEESQDRVKPLKRSEKRVNSSKGIEMKKRVKHLKGSGLKKRMKLSKGNELKKKVNSSKRSELMKNVKPLKGSGLKKRLKPLKKSESKEKVETSSKKKLIQALEIEKKDQTVTNLSVVENDKEIQMNDAAESMNYEDATKFLLPKTKKSRLRSPSIHDMKSLFDAAATGDVNCVQKLINAGVNFDAKNEFGWTALHCAVITGTHPCLKTLLKAGADCSVPAGWPLSDDEVRYNYASETPLHVAARYNCVTCAEELIQFGADCDAVNDKGYTSLHIATEGGCQEFVLFLLQNSLGLASLSLPNFECSNTPLYSAVECRLVKCVKEMVRLGSDVNHINRYGLSPLHTLLLTYENNDVDLEILKCLVVEGDGDINGIIDTSYTPLDLAISRRNLELVGFFVACGANVNFKTLLYPSSVDYGIFSKWGLEILKYLVTHVPQLPRLKSVLNPLVENLHSEFRLVSGETALYIEVIGHEVEIIEKSLRSDVMINLPVPKSMQYPLQQPFLNVIYERISDKLEDIQRADIAVKNNFDIATEKLLEKSHLLVLKRQLWYEQIASSPRTLQQLCRLSIRKCMGPSNFKHIRKLPLPEQVLSYLSFELKE